MGLTKHCKEPTTLKLTDINREQKSTNITYQNSKVSSACRLKPFAFTNQKGCTIWFTGLCCSGKTTIAFALEKYLIETLNVASYCLDGDNIRHGLNSDLGFTANERTENIRRVGEVAKLFADCGVICLSSFISPYQTDRERVRQNHERKHLRFVEVFVKTPLEVCERRDVKGLYKMARAGQIKGEIVGFD